MRQKFTPESAADYCSDLGFRMSKWHVYELIGRGVLPAAKVGRRYCIDREDLDRLLSPDEPQQRHGDPPPPARAGEYATG